MAARRPLIVAAILAISVACRETPHGATPPAIPAAGSASASASTSASAIELVESPPAETTLDHPDIPNAADVWVTLVDRARTSIDFAEFYASDAATKDLPTSKLAPVLSAIERAVARGVVVRFLADSVFAPKYPDTLDRLKRAGVTVRILDFGARGGGILHAKYFVVDGVESFVGSQNFDWRALEHIQEMGVHVTSAVVSGALLDIFDTDWELASGAPSETRVRRHASRYDREVRALTGERITLVGSPKGFLPNEASWDLPKLVALLDGSTRGIDVQLLTYKTKARDGSPFPTLDDALRRAAARGVRVRLLVSDWSSKPGSDARATLEALAALPNVEVRVIAIPKWSGGEIPFARVAHAKYMVVDGAHAWVGTSNWEGDYFTKSRNVGVIASGGALPPRLDRVFEGNWASAYASPLAPAQ